MSDTTSSMRRKISGAGDLQSVVRTMKAVAASSIGQYEKSVSALADYYRTVELGLGVCFRESGPAPLIAERKERKVAAAIGAIVFGSDQGLVGQFNDVVADHAIKALEALPTKPEVWAVGERVHARLADTGLKLMGVFTVPNSVKAITPLVGNILVETERHHSPAEATELYLFIIALHLEQFTRPSVSGCCRWTKSGGASWPSFPGQRRTCPKTWAVAPSPCERLSVNISSYHYSVRAQNPSRARTRAAWPRCNAPTKTSTKRWRISTGHSIACVRAASMKSSSM